MISAQQLHEIMPGCDAGAWVPHLTQPLADYAINSALRIATFLAHVAVESREMRVLVESLNYSAGRLMEVWPVTFPTAELAALYAHDSEKLGNLVYANRLGNGVPASGDGFRFRGRGLLQATGKEQYRAAGAALRIDLLGRPDLLEEPAWAARQAAWWWQNAGLNLVADRGDLETSTRRVNGGLNGYADRVAYWRRGLRILGAHSARPDPGGQIERVQHALNAALPEAHLTEDGIWGPLSEAAAARLRAAAGLPAARGVDAGLLHALRLA